MNFLLHRKVLLTMLFTGISLLGYISYQHLPTELMPSADAPTLIVHVNAPNTLYPVYIEQQAVIPLEGAISQLKGVKGIESISDHQTGRIQVSYQKGTNMKFAYLKLVEKMQEKESSLPEGFNVLVNRSDPEAINYMFMTLQARGSGGVDRVRKMVDSEILDKLQNIDGVALAEAFGGRRQAVQILLNDEALKAHQITPSQIQQLINYNNQAREFAGTVWHHNQNRVVNVVAEYHDLDEIKDLIVKEKGTVRLKDISTISFGVEEQTSYSRVNGKETVTIRLIKDSESNLIHLSKEVLDHIEELNQSLSGSDIEVVVEHNAAKVMEENIDLIIDLAFSGGILAIIVLWFFLRNIRLVATVALAIPVSLLAAFSLFYAYNISINIITLLGIALAIGMLLDNSIVVMENIYRLVAKHGDIDKAATKGTREVWRSIFAATLTTIVIFLPFAFSDNLEANTIGKNIGISVTATLLASLAVALLFIPMITHLFLKKKQKRNKLYLRHLPFHSRFVQVYMVFLKNCMRRPVPVILGAMMVFFGVLLLSAVVGRNYYQEPDIKELTLYVNMPEGSTLEKTDALVAEVESMLLDLGEKEDVISQIYEKEAVIKLSLKNDFKEIGNLSIPELKQNIMGRLLALKKAQFSWHPLGNGRRFPTGGGGMPGSANIGSLLGNPSSGEKIIIKGQDFNRLYQLAYDFKYQLEQKETMQGVYVGIPERSPEVLLSFDHFLMGIFDITPQSILAELRSFPSEFSAGATLKKDDEEFGILLSTGKKDNTEQVKERTLSDLQQMQIRNRNGTAFELGKISSFDFKEGLTTINRVNQTRQVEVYYGFLPEILQDSELLAASRLSVDEIVEDIHLPAGLAVEVVHDARDVSDFPFLIFAAFLLIYMILAAVFESFATPLVLMFSIPLAGIGSLLALMLTGNPILNHITLIGFMILLGIVVNNSIILIDYTSVLKRRGSSSPRALMTAGLARLRPILVTAITTIVALVPMALGKSEYLSLSGVPFAVTVIGGLFSSTLLTLVFIPTFNSALTESLRWINSQTTAIKCLMLALCLIGFYFIFSKEDVVIWQVIETILLVTIVPGTTYFIMSSLRQARERLISPNEEVVIRISNLVKIYDRENRFIRDLNAGKKRRQRLGFSGEAGTLKSLEPLIWQVPLLMFFYYFNYFYNENAGWKLIFPFILYPITLNTLNPLKAYFSESEKPWANRITLILYNSYFWLFPLLSLFMYYLRYDNPGLVIPIGILWYFLILVKKTADKLYRDRTNLNRLEGSFKGIRKAFFRFVLVVPFLGKRNIPFKALKGVSLEIKTGMFGLLGPNGAGKSTLIRIICGLLEPSYGLVTINGMDLKKKREELQGLIGYLPQEFGMYENMTAWDFLDYLAILKKITNNKEREARITYVLKAVHMYDSRDEKIGSFSGGMRQRIGIAQILLHLPKILVVDEPTAGLDPRERIRFRNLLVELSKERVVIFSTHIIEDVASSCNRLAVIKEGEVQYLGAPVQMAQTANGKVWAAELSLAEFDIFKENYVIIHHIRHGEMIRVRFLSESQPFNDAVAVSANLEDAYLYLLNRLKINKKSSPIPQSEDGQEIHEVVAG